MNDTFGGRNNVVVVKESDFDAGEALDVDSGEQKGSFGSLSMSCHDLFQNLLHLPHSVF